ncbi:serine hydrolase [Myceligenerans crystallogenes]|uniref:serine hydrolase domain-containing protein n=1 Tax=Myceligenerans crystallogenes TaxID=316335 RepID=UPI0031D2BADF
MTTTRPLPRSTPEAEGLDPAAVLRLVRNLDGLDAAHSFMLLRHGKVVAEGWWSPYDAATPQLLFSVSKSFTSLAVGLAIEDGLLSLDDRVLDHLAAEAPAAPSDNLRAMTVRDLLTMSTGNETSTIEAIVPTNLGRPDGDWIRQILAMPVPEKPGSQFRYNTGATYLAGVIVQRLIGRRLLDYLGERVLDPLGFEGATWEQDPDGLDVGGYGLSLRTEDIAKLGQLCLQRGSWNGEQLVPAGWIDAATSRQIATTHDWLEWQQGYGYQFWRSRFGAYRADGAFGQYAIVWPEHEVVLAITAGVRNLQSVQDAVWDGLLPALDPAAAKETGLPHDGARPSSAVLPPDDGVTWDLRLPLPQPLGGPDGTPDGPAGPGDAAGAGMPDTPMLGRTYRMTPNAGDLEELELSAGDDGRLALRFVRRGAEHGFALGVGEWVRQTADLGDGPAEVACAAAWAEPDLLVAHLVSVATPFTTTLTLRFDGDEVTAWMDLNVSFGETHVLDAKGTAI